MSRLSVCRTSGKSKNMYESRKEALCSKHTIGKRFNVKLFLYKCPDCRHYHLTRNVQGK